MTVIPEALRRMVGFEFAAEDRTGGQHKVQKLDYLPIGTIPVIDQGQLPIAGYTDDVTAVFSGGLPVILFGDHTLAFKYVDHPFALGADGVKALTVNKAFHPKYVFYYWQSCRIPSRGYSRHFKFLRDIRIPLIPLSEQRHVVEIFDQADALRRKRAEADGKAARILPALFYKMLGDPLALVNSGDSIPLVDLEVDLQNGFACGEKDVEDGVPHLRMNNIDDAGVLNLDLIRTVPLDRDTERYRLMERDVLFMGTNSADKIGKTCLFLPPDERPYLFSNHLIRLRVSDSRITPEYLAGVLHLLWSKRFFPSIAKRWVNQSTVAQSSLAALRIPLPATRSLQLFTNAYRNLLSLRVQRVHSEQSIEQIFAVLLHRAFTGDLTAKWREAHMKELLQEIEQQTKALNVRIEP